MTEEYRYLGNFSATPPWYDTGMVCHDCKVSWTGCWDNFQCPLCGQGELPNNNLHKAMIAAAQEKNDAAVRE